LTLKRDAVVLFIKNNPEKGYVNGTTGVVLGFEGDIPVVQTSMGQKIRVVAEDWTVENDKGETVATVSQVPLRLAWAITIHKSQGMTLDAAEIDLSKTFEVGQGYVALSRIKNIDGLRLMGLNEMALKVDPLTLRIDEPIKKASLKAAQEIESYSDNELDKSHTNYIKGLGGLTSFVQIEEEKKLIRAGKVSKMKDDVPTHIKTKALIESCSTLKEMAKSRGLTEGTIINHLAKVKEEDSSINLDKFRPKMDNFDLIEEEVFKLKRKNSSEDFSDDGRLRLKPLFDALDAKVSYDELRMAMLFV